MTRLRPFRPAGVLRGPHRQTIWSNYGPRPQMNGLRRLERTALVPTDDGDQIQVHWWQQPHPSPTLIVLHGLTGCAQSPNVLGIAAKAFARGFSVLRADLRNASGETPSIGIGHAGRSEDFRALVEHVRTNSPAQPIAAVGYSLGGNVTLKAAGEYGAAAPPELRAVGAISVPIDLDASCTSIDRTTNWPYRRYFLRRLGQTVQRRRALAPDLYRAVRLRGIRTLRDFDNAVVATTCGFRNAEDYYRMCSSIRFAAQIRLPTLLIQAQDDPFIPFAAFSDPRLRQNRSIRMMDPPHGGHVGFYAAHRGPDPDAYWAENRALEHCAQHVGLPPGSAA